MNKSVMELLRDVQGLKIGVDMDDTIFPFVRGLIRWHNRTYGTSWKIGQFYTYKFGQIEGFPKNAQERVIEYIESDSHWNIKPIKGARSALKRLNDWNDLVLITSRHEEYRDRTLEYIEQHIGDNIFQSFRFAYNHFTKNGKGGSKVEICEKEGIPIVIEDTVENARALNEAGRSVIMLDWPWNRGYSHPLTYRVSRWV